MREEIEKNKLFNVWVEENFGFDPLNIDPDDETQVMLVEAYRARFEDLGDGDKERSREFLNEQNEQKEQLLSSLFGSDQDRQLPPDDNIPGQSYSP